MRFLVVALLIMGTASAENVAHVRLLEDEGGDNMMSLGPASTPDPTDHANDLRFLDITEEVDGFWFTVGVESLERLGNDQSPSAIVWSVEFAHGEQPYQLQMIWGIDGGWRTDIYRIDGSSRVSIGSTAIERDFEANTVRSYLERDLLVDAAGAPPLRGASFTDVRVSTGGYMYDPTSGGALYSNGDTMPDAGGELGHYDVSWGAISDGPITMSSPLPYRVSNGAATTYLFEVDVQNLDGDSHRFFFREPSLPAGWTIRFPVDGVLLEPEEERRIPILVSLPFAHAHGKIDRTTLELAAEDAQIVGRLEIGVLFLEVPQPTGHHPRLWLHSHEQVPIEEVGWHFVYTPGADVFMNGREEDPGDAGTPIRGYHHEGGYEWYAFLEPGLLTGLDFKPGRDGEVELTFNLPAPLDGAILAGTLELVGPETSDSYDDRPSSITRSGSEFGGRELTTLGTLRPTDPTDLAGSSELSTVVEFPAELDIVEPRVGQTLLLRLRLEGTLPAALALEPTLVGGTLELPLDEYADPIDTSFLNELVDLAVLGEQERFGNPGDVIVFEAELTNPSDSSMDVGLELHGQGAAWAILHGEPRRSVGPGQTVQLAAIVTIPESAVDADRADLVLEAFDVRDPTLRSLVRYVAHVDTDAEWPSDADRIPATEAKEESPVPLWIALAGILVLLRRR